MRRLVLGSVVLVGVGCARVEVGRPAAATAAPEVRVALVLGATRVTLGGGSGLVVREPDGRELLRVPAGRTLAATWDRSGIALTVQESGGVRVMSTLPAILPEDPGGEGGVRVDGRDYRGAVVLMADPGGRGITAVNHVGVEEYLWGVVNAEMGRRGGSEQAALEVQAIASRTYAMRAIERFRDRPYDLVATIQDQAYGGMAAELPQGAEAVQRTRGQVLTYEGRLIDVFFSSTCGGRTAAGPEVFAGAAGIPYLVSVSDLDPHGEAWCVISPRFHWTEQWSGAALARTLRRSLPAAGITVDPDGPVRSIAVAARSASGRVARLAVRYGARQVEVQGAQVRQVLRPEGTVLLRSATFDLVASVAGGRVERLVVEGRGAGHGVGLCQWGTVGRARAGAGAPQILQAYFPGTEVQRLF